MESTPPKLRKIKGDTCVECGIRIEHAAYGTAHGWICGDCQERHIKK